MILTRSEQITLMVLGSLALVALGFRIGQLQRPDFIIHEVPVPIAEAARWDAALAASRTVDVNTASGAELERLPEIGSVLIIYLPSPGVCRSLTKV